jgi:predicted NAD/FAD-binding protein
MKIAVIGSGISGLSTAIFLNEDHDVHLIEKDSRLGGHANTVNIAIQDKPISVDTGFIVYNEVNYPLFTKLLTHLDVVSQPTEMSFSVSEAKNGFEFRPTGLKTLFPSFKNLTNSSFLYMLFEIPRFNESVKKAISEQITLGEFIQKYNFSSFLSKYYITPLSASIWSASTEDIMSMPLVTFVNFMTNHGLLSFRHQLQWRTIPGGSIKYVETIASLLKNKPRTNTDLLYIERDEKEVRLYYKNSPEEKFDAVFIATHADTALRLLKNPTEEETRALSKFKFSKNKAVLHSDSSLLPAHKAVRASWNFHILTQSREKVTITYLMNKLQPLETKADILISLGMDRHIREDLVIDSFDYEHPIIDHDALKGQADIEALQGTKNTYYVGAWLGYGFHEDGIRSADKATKEFLRRHFNHSNSFLD